MIKMMRFASAGPLTHPGVFAALVRRQAAQAVAAPLAARPLRVTVATALPSAARARPPHDAVAISWFTDNAHVARFEAWLAACPRDTFQSTNVIADERIARGAEWLTTHRRGGAHVYKHMALARRAPEVSPGEFSRRWAAHAGQVRVAGPANPTSVPARVRGDACVQNRAVEFPGVDQAYHVINEVYFAEPDALWEHVAWCDANPPGPADGDLFGPSEYVVLREEVLLAGTVGVG